MKIVLGSFTVPSYINKYLKLPVQYSDTLIKAFHSSDVHGSIFENLVQKYSMLYYTQHFEG